MTTRNSKPIKHEYLYFAYGSNMCLDQMKYRCPTAQCYCMGELKGWKLVERMHADIEQANGRSVFGMLFLITRDDLRALDRYEGFPTYYDRKIVEVDTERGRFHAIVYEMTQQCKKERDWFPYGESYRKACYEAAEFHKLPVNEYQKSEAYSG